MLLFDIDSHLFRQLKGTTVQSYYCFLPDSRFLRISRASFDLADRLIEDTPGLLGNTERKGGCCYIYIIERFTLNRL